MSAVLAVDAGRFFFFFFFCPLSVHFSLAINNGKKIIQHLLQTIPFSPLPHLLDRKHSPAPVALAAGAGHSFLPFPIQPYPLKQELGHKVSCSVICTVVILNI